VKIIKNISVLLFTLIVLATSNGFILEQYFCSGCHEERNDVAFFEFGEIKHEHQACQYCTQNSGVCSCQNDNHLSNTKISYFSLDQLSFKIIERDQVKVLFTRILSQFDLFNYTIIKDYEYSNPLISLLKIPPLIATDAGSIIFNAVISVFRL
jgi:hypothetical protein